MKNKKLLYAVLAIAIVVILLVTLMTVGGGKEDAPIHRPGDNNKQANKTSDKSKNASGNLEKDLEKYREAKPVSNAKADKDKASENSIYLNTDNKVLVETDSNNAEEIRDSMMKWNSALGENVFLPAKENGRTDLLIKDDETKVPVNIFGGETLDDEVPDKYKERVVPTQDHRIMILDNMKQRYEEEFNYRIEDEINQKLGNVIGVEGDVETIKNKLSSDSGREELKEKFKQSKDKELYNEGITSKDKETDSMDNPSNKTYATMTNYRENLANLPRLKDNNQELLSVIDSKEDVLYGDEAVEQGEAINDVLQTTLKDIQRGSSNSSTGGEYYDNSDLHDGKKTIAGTNSKMGSDKTFIQLNSSYHGGE